MRLPSYLVAVVVVLCSCELVKAQDVNVLDFPSAISQLVVSPTSGVAAAMEAEKVLLYPKLSSQVSLQGPIAVQINGKPVAIAHKPTKSGGVFIAADDRQNIFVVDDASGKPLGSVNVGADVVDVAAPLSGESNLVFYVTRAGRNGTSVVGRIDTAAMKDLGLFPNPDYSSDLFVIEAAADGRTVYLARPNISPTGIYVMRQESGDENRLAKAHEEHNTVAMYVPLPSGLGTAMNKELKTLDAASTMRELPGIALCSMSSRPVIFCQSEDRTSIIAASLNTGKPVATLRFAVDPMQAGGLAANRARAGRADQVRLRKLKRWGSVDEANQNLILNSSRAAYVIPLSAFRLPDEPLMVARLDGATELVANQPWQARLVGASKDVQIALGQAPEGMKLDGQTLSWTPASTNVGAARITLQLSGKGVKSEQQLDLMVRQPWIRLPFTVSSYSATPDGSKLIILRSDPRNGSGAEARTSQLAAVEMASGKVLFDKQLDFRASALEASNDTVFMGAQGVDAIYSMSIKSPDQVNKTFTDGRVVSMSVAGDRLYAYLSRRNGGGNTTIYALPKLEPIEGNSPLSGVYFQDGARAMPVDVGGGWRHGEGVWTSDFSKVKLLLDAPTVPTLMLRGNVERDNPEGVARWGTSAQGGQIRRLSGQVITQGNDLSSGVLLVDLPAAAFLRLKSTRDTERQANIARAELVVVDLVDGREDQLPLMNERADQTRLNPEDYRYGGRRGMIFSQPGKICAILSDKLFIMPTKLLAAQRFVEPLYFEAEQNPVMVSGRGVAKVNYKVDGGRKPLRFSLLADAPGLEINATTGELSIDAQKLLSGERLDYLVDQYSRVGTIEYSANGGRPQQMNLLQRAAKQIQLVQNWTGSKPTGIPIAIRNGIRARDASQQEAVLEHCILIDMPVAILQGRYDERLRLSRAQEGQQRQVYEQQRQLNQQHNAPTSNPGDVAGLTRRVHELELENARLKAQLDLLKELHQNGPASRPIR